MSHVPPQAEGAAPTDDEDLNTWEALQKVTDKKRADILADIVGHPEGMPSVEELDYMNPPMSDDAIRRHLKTLMNVGVVEEREFPPGQRYREYPYKFYRLTDAARELFDRNGLFPEAAWKREYKSVKKTTRIEEIEAMPRPDDE